MIAVVVVLAVVVAALAGALIAANRQILASHESLMRAVVAKNGSELALMNRSERKPAKPIAESTPYLTDREQYEARIAAETARMEGELRNGVPVGFDGN